MSEVLDLFLLTHQTQLLGQMCINTYTYVLTEQVGSPLPAAQSLRDAWRIRFLETDGAGFQCGSISDDLLSVLVRSQNLYNDLDYSEYLDGTAAGTSTAEPMPPWVTFSFRTPWLGPALRRGFKRIPGVGEGYGNSGIINAGNLANLANFSSVMNESLTVVSGDDSITFHPCVVKRIKYVTPNGKDAYRLPENAQEGVFDIVQGWQAETELTTQNSRKRGVGF